MSGAHWSYWWQYNRSRFIASTHLAPTETPDPDGALSGARDDFWREVATDALLATLGDRHPDPSTGAAIALGKANASEAIVRLSRLFLERSTERTLRESLALALGMMGRESSRDALRDVLASENEAWRLRAFSAIGLGLTRSPEALPALVATVRSDRVDREVRSAALIALGLLGDRVVTPLLIDAVTGRLRKLHHLERSAAIDALGKLRDREALPALLKAISDDRSEIRRAAVLALGRIAGPSDRSAQTAVAITAMRDRDLITRCYATIAIGRMGVPRGSATLCRLMNDPNAAVRGFAALGLSLLARRNGEDGLRKRTASFLRGKLTGEPLSSDATGAVVIALGILRDREARSHLVKLFTSKAPPALRGHVALALGMIGVREALPALKEALTTERDPWVQREVALALGLLGDTGSVAPLVKLVRNGRSEYVRGNAALALGHIGSPTASRAMIELMSSKGAASPTRGMAAVALGYLLDRRPLPALFAVVEDFDYMLPLGAFYELLTIL